MPSSFTYTGSGGLVLSGIATSSVGFPYTASGGVALSGTGFSESAKLIIVFDQEFEWNVDQDISIDQEFEWQFGNPIYYWFQVESCCQPTNCNFVVNNDSQCQKTTFTIPLLATSVENVCQQLTAQGITSQICGIKQFSKAAYVNDQATLAAQGINQTCNTLNTLPFCELPDCLQFCINYDVAISFGFSFYTNVEYIATGGVIISGEAIVDDLESMMFAQSLEIDSNIDIGFFGALTYSQVTLNAEQDIEDSTDSDVPTLEPSVGTIKTLCDCNSIGEIIQIQNNFANSGILQDFLIRNNIVNPSVLQMSYNTIYQSWQSNLHLSGISSSGGSESWNIILSWQCTSIVGGMDQGVPLWVFGASLTQTFDGERFDTRVLLVFSQDGPCQETNSISFSFTTNTLMNVTTSDPNHNNYNTIIQDGIGLFRSPSWTINPLLNITISQVVTTSPVTRLPYDFSPIFTES